MTGLTKGISDRTFSMGVWAWLMIVEREAHMLSPGAQAALGALRDDLEAMASGQERSDG